MSIALKQYETYQNMQLQGASREELLLKTFEWLLAAIRRGRRSAAAKRAPAARRALMNAQSGVIYLMGTLDMEVGGELATRLRLLYVYLLRRLGEAAVDLDTIAICEAEGIVATLASSWQEAVSRS